MNISEIRSRFPKANNILIEAPMLHVGWEMDNEICVVEMNNGKRVIFGTSHGAVCKINASFLHAKLKQYREAIVLTDAALVVASETKKRA